MCACLGRLLSGDEEIVDRLTVAGMERDFDTTCECGGNCCEEDR